MITGEQNGITGVTNALNIILYEANRVEEIGYHPHRKSHDPGIPVLIKALDPHFVSGIERKSG